MLGGHHGLRKANSRVAVYITVIQIAVSGLAAAVRLIHAAQTMQRRAEQAELEA